VQLAGAPISTLVPALTFTFGRGTGHRELRTARSALDDASIGVPPPDLADVKCVAAHRAPAGTTKGEMATLTHPYGFD